MENGAGQLRCHNCGTMFARRAGADLHCSDSCSKEYAEKLTAAGVALAANGFAQLGNSNGWTKDGFVVTSGHVVREGLDAVLKAHAELTSKAVASAATP